MLNGTFLREAVKVARLSPIYQLLDRAERRQVILTIYIDLLKVRGLLNS